MEAASSILTVDNGRARPSGRAYDDIATVEVEIAVAWPGVGAGRDEHRVGDQSGVDSGLDSGLTRRDMDRRGVHGTGRRKNKDDQDDRQEERARDHEQILP
jgi:hypothetical protein